MLRGFESTSERRNRNSERTGRERHVSVVERVWKPWSGLSIKFQESPPQPLRLEDGTDSIALTGTTEAHKGSL